jgi:hypothetical protein
MVYAPHYLIAFGGPLYTTEIWSSSIRMSLSLDSSLVEHPTWCADHIDDVVSDISDYVNSWAFGLQAKLGYVKFNKINADGHYADPTATVERFLTGTLPEGPASTTYPAQVTTCVTHHSARARGVGSRGRMFLPVPTTAISTTTGKMAVGAGTTIATAHAIFINNLNEWPGAEPHSGAECSIVSKKDASVNKITSVSCGLVLDTIRTRRNALVEAYEANTTPIT